MKYLQKSIVFIYGICVLSCSANQSSEPYNPGDPENPVSEIETKDPVPGIRIAWDYTTQTQISKVNEQSYNGYARLIQLGDESLLVTYESNGNVLVKMSNDLGSSWSEPVTVATSKEGVNMATPDLLQLENGSILLSYNPRPGETAAISKRFLIKTILSTDGGMTWGNDQTVYEGDTKFDNGVWEPTLLQLPSGEIQLFFSNENVYQSTNEQNISVLRSTNNGITWTKEPEITSFRSGSRDGMPSPIYLQNKNEIVYSIEDNGSNNEFKPYIIRNSISENWSQTVSGNNENRSYALKESLEDSEHAGATYLAQLLTSETLLSYQGTENRNGNSISNAEMRVAIGDDNAKNFDRITTPFLISENSSALWNSIAVLKDNSVVALTTTNAFSSTKSAEVWMIKGFVIPELKAENMSVLIDGETSEDIWQQDFPILIGHKGETQLKANVSADANNLYVITKVLDKAILSTSENINNNDGTAIYLDPSNKNYEKPDKGVFKINISVANEIQIFEGNNSEWVEIEMPEIKTAVKNIDGYIQEISIPWNSIGGKPGSNSRIGFSMELIERGNSNYSEMLSTTQPNAPYTWLSLKL
ncbi:MAG: hypothetical protein GZ086_06800 [Gelidibacter sp.]|nr:hypothetical protein [Gelidibacter sp.]